ncbi:MAG: phosphate signaling complex protein PhoU [Acidimicrobiia bacterium]
MTTAAPSGKKMAEIRRSYHEQLDDLCHDVCRLGALATEAIGAGTEALLEADLASADRVITADMFLDDLTRSIEERAYRLLALQQPMASDLRRLVTVLRIIHEIERTGDLIVNVAKTTRRLYPFETPPRIRGLIARMGNQAAVQLRVAMEAFAEEDAPRALALPDMDDVMDELQKDLFRAIFATGEEGEAGLHRAVQVALVGRYYERIADHAVNVGQRVAYMVTGELPTGEGFGEVSLS